MMSTSRLYKQMDSSAVNALPGGYVHIHRAHQEKRRSAQYSEHPSRMHLMTIQVSCYESDSLNNPHSLKVSI